MQYPKRKHIRLKTHDYAQSGVYFLTLCVREKVPMLGILCETETDVFIKRSSYGESVDACVREIEKHYSHVKLRRYMLMPDHIHLLVQIRNKADIPSEEKTASVCDIVKGLKRAVTKKIGFSIWQNSFYERIIKDREAYVSVCRYIDQNPRKWAENPIHDRVKLIDDTLDCTLQ